MHRDDCTSNLLCNSPRGLQAVRRIQFLRQQESSPITSSENLSTSFNCEQFLTRFYFNHVTSDNTTQKPGQYDKSEECLFVKQVSVPEKSHTVLQDETVVFHDTGNCEFFMTSFLTDFSLASSVRLKQSCHSLSFLIASTLGKRRVTPVLNLEIKDDDRP